MTDVYFATNRNPLPAAKGYFGERFHPDGPMFFRVGWADLKKISDDPDNPYKIVRIEAYEEKLSAKGEESKRALGSSQMFKDLRTQMKKDKRDVIVLIHGFACTFADSIQRAAQIKQSYRIDGKEDDPGYEPYVVVFSWPSNGRIEPPWEYHSDRQDAEASGTAMARFMMRLIDFLSDGSGNCEQRVHLVAHSMGNWAMRNAVQALAQLIESAKFPTLFTNAFMMAADEDEDTFETDHKLGRLPELARSVHVYHSRGDKVLIISDTTKLNPDRVGSGGPKSFSGLSNRIVAVDCVNVDFTRLTHGNHQYYRLRPEVIADVRAVLSGRFLPDQIPARKVVEPGRRFRIVPAAGQALPQ